MHLKIQISRELDRLELLLEQIRAVEAERDALLAAQHVAALAPGGDVAWHQRHRFGVRRHSLAGMILALSVSASARHVGIIREIIKAGNLAEFDRPFSRSVSEPRSGA
jgi:transposase